MYRPYIASVTDLFSNVRMPLIVAPWHVPVQSDYCHSIRIAILSRCEGLGLQLYDRVHKMKLGEVVVIPPNYAYGFRTNGEKGKWASLVLRSEFLNSGMRFVPNSEAKSRVQNLIDSNDVVSIQPETRTIQFFRDMRNCRDATSALTSIGEYLNHISELRSDQAIRLYERKPASKLVLELIKKIIVELPSSVGLESYGKLHGASPAKVIREFTAYTGLTPQQYLRYRKVHLALQLILEKVPMKNIVSTIGFSNPAHLTSSFYQFFGCSPRAMASRVRIFRRNLALSSGE